MKKLFLALLSVLLLIGGMLFVLQGRWTKEQLAHVLQEVALQSGVKLSIGRIEGKLPLSWSFSHVHLSSAGGETVDIDHLKLRLALLPLLRGKWHISYLQADHVKIEAINFSQKDPADLKPDVEKESDVLALFKDSFSIRSLAVDRITLIDKEGQREATYNLKGEIRWTDQGKLFLIETALRSTALDLTVFCKGNQNTDHVQLDLNLKMRSEDPFISLKNLPLLSSYGRLPLNLEMHSEGSWKTLHSLIFSSPASPSAKPIAGSIKLQMKKSPFPRLEDSSVDLFSDFSLFSDKSWNLSKASLKSDLCTIQGSAQFSSNQNLKSLQAKASFPNLSYLAESLEGKALLEASLKENELWIALKLPELSVARTPFPKAEIDLVARPEKILPSTGDLLTHADKWVAKMKMELAHPALNCKGSAAVVWLPNQALEMTGLHLKGLIGELTGNLSFFFQDKTVHGGIAFQLTDISPLSTIVSADLGGQIGGSLLFAGEECNLFAIGKQLKLNQFLSTRVDLDLTQINLSTWQVGTLKISSDQAYLGSAYFNSFGYEMKWNTIDWDYLLEGSGEWKGDFYFSSQGTLNPSLDKLQLTCLQLNGGALEKQISLQHPFHCEISREEFKIDQIDIAFEEGKFLLSSTWTPSYASFQLKTDHFPIDFLTLFTSRLSLQGLSTIEMELKGAPHELQGRVNLSLARADIYTAGNPQCVQTKGNIQAHFAKDTLQLHANFIATGDQHSEISVTLPVSLQLTPLRFKAIEGRPISGQCIIEGHLEQLFDFVNLGPQRLGGFLSSRLLLSGTLDRPILYGPIFMQGGFYENYFIGIAVKDANLDAEATGKQIVVSQVVTTDGSVGSSQAKGVFKLSKSIPFYIEGSIKNFRVIGFDWLVAACTGPFTIRGDLKEARLKGKLEVDSADVHIPEQLPSDLPALPITLIHQPKSREPQLKYSTPYPFYYDLDVHGDHNLKLTGRGLDAELEGNIHMSGKNLSVLPSGTLNTKTGTFSFAGSKFTITKGELVFSEGSSFLNMTSNVEFADLFVNIYFRGELTSPKLSFESNPPLPTSSILSHILFNKDVSELSAPQAVQLASTIVTLSGESGPNILESIRKNLGIDKLSISASEETGVVAIQIGKYLTQGVLITLIQGTESSLVKVNVELKAGFALEAETRPDKPNKQGKFSLKWNKNY